MVKLWTYYSNMYVYSRKRSENIKGNFYTRLLKFIHTHECLDRVYENKGIF